MNEYKQAGYQDAKDGKSILESDVVKSEGLQGENIKDYMAGYSLFAEEVKKQSDNEEKIKESLLETVNRVIYGENHSEDEDEDENDSDHDPQAFIYGTSKVMTQAVSLGSSESLLVTYYPSDEDDSNRYSLDNIESVKAISHGFDHVELELTDDLIEALYKAEVF